MKAAHPTFDVSPAVVAYVARAITANGRDLEGAVNRLLAHATLTGSAVTLETAETAIRDLVRNREPKPGQDRGHPEARRLSLQCLAAPTSSPSAAPRPWSARARSPCISSKVLTLRSLPEIGRRFGGRDHTTVLHAVRKIEKAIGEDSALHDEVELLKRMLQE